MSGGNNDGLSLLISSYDAEEGASSDESEDDFHIQFQRETLLSKKRFAETEDNDKKKVKKLRETSERNGKVNAGLPIPKGILDMFDDKDADSDDSADHEGRVRSFEHFPGNWALHIYIPFFASVELGSIIRSLVGSLPSNLVPMMHLFSYKELHLSLSRTVPIRHYWINSIVDPLRTALSTRHRFCCVLENPELYTNDEKTRSFIGLKVLTGQDQLQQLVTNVNEVFKEFALPKFYENPSFHVSIAWCLGDIHCYLSERDEQAFQDSFESLVSEMPSSNALSFEASEVRCRIGNKLFTFPLDAS